MALRSKSQMRLLILAAASAVVVGGVGGFIWYRRVQRHNFILTELPAGMQAYKDGETVKALQLLGDYLRNIDSDNVDAIAAYADVRMALPERNNEQISDLTARYRRLIALKPTDKQYKYKLLKVYAAGDMHAEADQLAESMLKEDPKDVEARQRLTAALMGLKKWPEARASALKTLETDPLSTVAAQQVLTCMGAMQLSGAAMQNWGLDWLKGREGEPGELLFEAMVWDYAAVDNQGGIHDDMTAKAVGVLNKMMDEKPRSAEYVGYAVTIMDNVNQGDLATKYLEKYRGLYNDIKLDERFYRRLAYAGQFARMEKELSDPARHSEKSTLLTALRFMALAEQKKFDEARPLLDVLKERGQRWDFGAEDWRQVLSMVYFEEAPLDHPGDKVVKLRQRDLLDTLTNACLRAPDEAFFQCFLGDAYAHSGDAASAIARWEGTKKLAPSWARPWMQLATMAEAMKDPFTAMSQARQANILQPNQPDIMVTLLRAWNAALSQNPLDLKVDGEDSPKNMLALLERIRTEFPALEAIIPLQVEIELKLNGDKPRAIQLVKGEIAAQPALSELTLLRLAVVCNDNALEDNNLPLDEQCIVASEKAHGSSPQASWTRATLDRVKDYQGAKEVLLAAKNKGVAQAAGQKDGDATILEWGIVWGRFLEAAQDKEAPEAWRDIVYEPGTKDLPGDKKVLTEDTKVLWAVVGTTSMWKDHVFMGNVLDKLKSNNGESGLSWRLEESRWLLEDKSRDSQKAAMDLLNDTVRIWPKSSAVRELLAKAFENAGNLSSASAQRIIASELDAHNLSLKIAAAQLLLQQGESARAQPLLETVLQAAWATDVQRLQAAVLLSDVPQQEASEAAMKALQSPARSAAMALYQTDDTHAAALTVAVLYWRLALEHPSPNNENYTRASAAFAELLKKPNADIIEQAASYYLSIADAGSAQLAIDKLDTITVGDVRKDTIRGYFLLKSGKNKDAVIALRAAVNVIDSPPLPDTWRWLMAALVTDNQISGADGVIAVAKGLKAEVQRVTDAWNKTKSDPAATPLQMAETMNRSDEMQLLADNPAVKACAADSDALKKMLTDEDGRNFMVSCLFSPLDAKTAQDVVLAFGAKEPQDTTQSLKILAARSQDSLALQILAIRRLVVGNQIDEALHLAEQAETTHPESPMPASYASTCYTILGQWDKALEAAQRWQKNSGNDASSASMQEAKALVAMKRDKEAQDLLTKHLNDKDVDRSTQSYREMLYVVVSSMAQEGRVKEARDLLWPQVLKDPKLADAWARIGSDAVPPKDAEAWLKQQEEVTRPDDMEGQMRVGLSLYRLGARLAAKLMLPANPAEAEAQAKDGERIQARGFKVMEDAVHMYDGKPDPDKDTQLMHQLTTARAALILAGACDLSGDLPNAEKYYLLTVKDDSRLHPAYNNLAMILAREGKNLSEAVDYVNKAIAAQPNAAYYDTLSFVLAKNKQYKEAVAALDSAIGLEPTNPLWQINRIDLLLTAGNTVEAEKSMKKLEDQYHFDPSTFPDDMLEKYNNARKKLGRVPK